METIYRLLEAKTTSHIYQHKDDPASGVSPPMGKLDFFLTEIDEMLKEKDKTIQLLANALKECATTLEEVDGSADDTRELIKLAEKYLND